MHAVRMHDPVCHKIRKKKENSEYDEMGIEYLSGVGGHEEEFRLVRERDIERGGRIEADDDGEEHPLALEVGKRGQERYDDDENDVKVQCIEHMVTV